MYRGLGLGVLSFSDNANTTLECRFIQLTSIKQEETHFQNSVASYKPSMLYISVIEKPLESPAF